MEKNNTVQCTKSVSMYSENVQNISRKQHFAIHASLFHVILKMGSALRRSPRLWLLDSRWVHTHLQQYSLQLIYERKRYSV